MSEVVVHKGRTNIVIVDMGMNISAETFTSQIRSTPNQDATLIAEWDVTFQTNGSDGLLRLVLDDLATSQIKATSGFMDLKRMISGEPFAAFDKPLEVTFRGTVTV
jgi:hypothetical protein